jgi:hypothetical protein
MKELISTRNFDKDTLDNILKTLDGWTDKINKLDNFSFVKFGDGEFFCMMGENGGNCDFHPYSEDLGKKLFDAWYFFNSLNNIYIAEWANHKPGMTSVTKSEKFQYELMDKTPKINVKFVNFEILLQNTLSQNKFDFLKSVKYSERKKIFVGPKRLFGIKSFLNVDELIEIPLVNSFSEYDNILVLLKSEIVDNSIILFSSGMPAKSLIHKAIEFNSNITCLDVGSGFDSLIFGKTREGQMSINQVKKYYEKL